MASLKPSGESDSGKGDSHLCHLTGGSGKGRATNTVGFPSVETKLVLDKWDGGAVSTRVSC